MNSTIKHRKFVSEPECKESIVSPLYKNPEKGSRLQKSDFRPVSVLTAFSKIFEKYYQNSMLKFTESILSEKISAYRKGSSCQHVLMSLTEQWRKYIDQNQYVGAVLMDLSKAFDCLPHELLISKLHAYGLGKKTLRLLYSYLRGRKQRVNINGTYSTILEILSGVPQGSILGPILFNIFVNDLLFYIKSADPFNYADDNNLSSHASNLEKLVANLENATRESVDWLDENEMIANAKKFKAIILKKGMPNTSKTCVKIKDLAILSENEVTSLGIKLDNKLAYSEQISDLCKLAGGRLNALKRLSKYLPLDVRKYYTNTYVLSVFNYGSNVWHFSGLVELHKMERVNERAIRFMYDDQSTEYYQILKEKNEKTLYGKRIRSICCEIFKSRHDLNPKYMADIFEQRPSPYPSRRPHDIFVPGYVSKTFGKNSLRIDGASLWNSLPENLKSASCLAVFKKGINELMTPTCQCNKNCIDCTVDRVIPLLLQYFLFVIVIYVCRI